MHIKIAKIKIAQNFFFIFLLQTRLEQTHSNSATHFLTQLSYNWQTRKLVIVSGRAKVFFQEGQAIVD